MPEPLSRPADILDQLRRIDSICARFERCWKVGNPSHIERELESAQVEDYPVLLGELLPLEWTYRLRQQQSFTLDEYCARFAPFATVVTSAWQRWHDSADNTPLPQSLQSTIKPGRSPLDPNQPTLTPSQAAGLPPLPEMLPGERALPAGYQNVEPLGEGGMGVVYKAYDARLKRPVALKKVRALSPDRLARFRIEAEALARLSHPHIVGVHAWDEKEGEPILVLEYVSGGDLDERLRKQPLRLDEAIRLVAILARAVQSAHEAGVVHRDLKPANVLLGPPVAGNAGTVAGFFPKVSDFGLARLVEGDGQTISGMMIGTPSYMAPEQAEGKVREMGPPADVWALGVILYRCLSGKLPFAGESALRTMELIRAHPPTPLRHQMPNVPAELEALCEACLQKSPGKRPTAARMAEELERFAGGAKTEPSGTIITEAKRGFSRRGVVAALLSVAVLSGGVLGWWLLGNKAEQAEGKQEVAPGAPAAPLRVKAFRVAHFAVDNGKSVESGEIGKESAGARYKDEVRLELELSEPAYLYLLAYNPDGREQLLWPMDAVNPSGGEQMVPGRLKGLKYPQAGDETFHLDDEPKGGWQAFAVVASRQPMPAFAKWKQGRGDAAWGKWPEGGGVWFADREGVQRVKEGVGVVRGTTGRATGAPPLRELVRSLATGGGEVVEVLAFGVKARGG